MRCTTVRDMLFRRIDNELPEFEKAKLDAHLAECPACSREYRLVSLPTRMAQMIPPVEPSPFFYQKLRTTIEGEALSAARWEIFVHLARQVIPALAGITLALLSVFAYTQLTGKEIDLYKAYNRAFLSEDQPHRMFAQGEITDEAVINALVENEAARKSPELK